MDDIVIKKHEMVKKEAEDRIKWATK